MMKLRLMLRYLLSKLGEMSSEVKSPRLLDMEAVGGAPPDCLSPSMKSRLQVCLRSDSLLGVSSQGLCWGCCWMLGLDLLLVTCAEEQDRRGARVCWRLGLDFVTCAELERREAWGRPGQGGV